MSDVVEANSSFLCVDRRSSMLQEKECFKSLEQFSNKLSCFISTLADITRWGKNCQIQTFDFSGFPVAESEVRALSALSRLKIPDDWPQITSNFFEEFLTVGKNVSILIGAWTFCQLTV